MRRAYVSGTLITVLLLFAPMASRAAEVADLVGKTVVEVRIFRDGVRVPDADRSTLDLVETRAGEPLSMRQVRESETHLFSLGDFGDVRVSATEDPRGVLLRYDLIRLQAAGDVEVRGSLGRPRAELLELIARRFGRVVRADQIPAVVTLLEELYKESGRFAARISADPGAADGRLVFDIDQGPAARIDRIDVSGVEEDGRAGVLERLGLGEGADYDPVVTEMRLAEYEAEVRGRRYYEARFRHEVTPSPDGRTVELALDIQTGSPVSISFEGDEVPDARLEDLVPVAREGSVDEDLLEDSSLRVEAHLRGLGYRDARVTHRRLAEIGELSIVFTVDRGPQYRLVEVVFDGNRTLQDTELRALFGVVPGTSLVMADVEAGAAAVAGRYARLGYRTIQVRPASSDRERPDTGDPTQIVPVSLTIEIDEGPRTVVGALSFEGATAFSAAELGGLVASVTGAPYYAPQIAAGADAVLVHYLNEGYETAQVEVAPGFDESGTTADVRFLVREGPQVLVDHVLVVGNRQISVASIRAEMVLRPGEPLGLDEFAETRSRLSALGVFRGIDFREFSHGDGSRRDVVVIVEEAPANRVGYGGGLEVSQRLRATEAGAAAERLELAPRGFFEIGRRNLWGKNREINLFTRVSVRRSDDADVEMPQSSLGFNEYRVLLNYREPRAFRQSGDLFVSGFVEQAIRPSFDLFSRGVTAELRRAIGLTMTGSVGYAYGQNEVTNSQLEPEDQPLVDRLFEKLTLSTISSGLVRDTRDDALDPTRGSLVGVDGKVAFRFLGSEVGFAKTTLQGRVYRQLPGDLVFAAGARLGLARGFDRTVTLAIPIPVIGDDGVVVLVDGIELEPEKLEDLPASERFFAGGDTTVRGFALDRLGDDPTIDLNGFPSGGSAMIVLNSELRVPVTGAWQAVGFLDAGNVFDRVSNLSLGRIRGAAGFGVRYRSPVGPIRVDLGFKLDRREFAGERERLTALHVSIGPAF
ncbi:MAG: BamA/TamA family outer membrane protein [Vicinamibacterales bacterium]|nr:BamA/TamA family outer membrane protein [Vicinamibacterales bacterium]